MENKFMGTPYFGDTHSAELEAAFSKLGWAINKIDLPAGNAQTRMGVLSQPLAQFVMNTAKMGNRPVTVFGDCCMTIPMLAGLQQAGIDPVLIWLDAHGDLNTWETTPSGFLGGMPLAMMLGHGEQTICEAVGLQTLSDSDTILTDARELDPGEQALLDNSKIIHLKKLTDLLEYAMPSKPIYVHFDTDLLDPSDAPAMAYSTSDGPALADVERVFDHLAKNNNIVAASLSTWRPNMDENGRTQATCLNLLDRLLI